jgi:hypothetical protein
MVAAIMAAPVLAMVMPVAAMRVLVPGCTVLVPGCTVRVLVPGCTVRVLVPGHVVLGRNAGCWRGAVAVFVLRHGNPLIAGVASSVSPP